METSELIPLSKTSFAKLLKPKPTTMSLFKYTIKPVEVTPQEAVLLDQITDLLKMVKEHENHWILSNAKKTMSYISETMAVLFALSTAITSTDYKLERAVLAIYNRNLTDCLKAFRCPVTKDENIRKKIRETKMVFRTKFAQLIHQMYLLFKNTDEAALSKIKSDSSKPLMLEFLATSEKQVEMADIDQDFIETDVVMNTDNNNNA